MYVEHSGQTLKAIEKAMDRDNFMSAEEAKAFGLIDHVTRERPKAEKAESGAASATTTPILVDYLPERPQRGDLFGGPCAVYLGWRVTGSVDG